MSTVQQKIGGTDNIKDSYDGQRKSLRENLETLTKQRTEVSDSRGKLLDKIKSLQASIKKKVFFYILIITAFLLSIFLNIFFVCFCRLRM